jgi:hypothetical protein
MVDSCTIVLVVASPLVLVDEKAKFWFKTKINKILNFTNSTEKSQNNQQMDEIKDASIIKQEIEGVSKKRDVNGE